MPRVIPLSYEDDSTNRANNACNNPKDETCYHFCLFPVSRALLSQESVYSLPTVEPTTPPRLLAPLRGLEGIVLEGVILLMFFPIIHALPKGLLHPMSGIFFSCNTKTMHYRTRRHR